MKEYTDEEARELAEQTAREAVHLPRIISAHYQQGKMEVEIQVTAAGTGGRLTFFPARCVPELTKATNEELSQFRIIPSKSGIIWPAFGVGLTVEAIIRATFNIQTLRSHVSKAGATKTKAKSEAARANGAKGGRPRKVPVSG